MSLHRLLYRSDAALAGSPDRSAQLLQAIVENARISNKASGLTGALMLSSGVFLQALEGPLDALERTFERICRDLRHRRVRLLEFGMADERVFGAWTMADVVPMRELARIGPVLATADATCVDSVLADGVIQSMRSMLLVGSTPDRQRPEHSPGGSRSVLGGTRRAGMM